MIDAALQSKFRAKAKMVARLLTPKEEL